MIKNKKAITKLRALQKYLLDEPRRFNLRSWGVHINPTTPKQQLKEEFGIEGHIELIEKQNPPCGTVACLAGNLCVMGKLIGPKQFKNEIIFEFGNSTPDLARKYLGLTEEEANPLFYLKEWGFGFGWPEQFAKRLARHKSGTKAYAKIAVARIEHYINTGQ